MIQRVGIAELTPSDLGWLARCCEEDYDGATPKDYMRDALEGKYQLWRLRPPMEGLLITEVIRQYNGTALVVRGLAGRGVLPHVPALAEAALRWAKAQGCVRAIVYSARPGLDRIYSKLYGPPRSREFVKEI